MPSHTLALFLLRFCFFVILLFVSLPPSAYLGQVESQILLQKLSEQDNPYAIIASWVRTINSMLQRCFPRIKSSMQMPATRRGAGNYCCVIATSFLERLPGIIGSGGQTFFSRSCDSERTRSGCNVPCCHFLFFAVDVDVYLSNEQSIED